MSSGFITSPIPMWSIRRRARPPPRSISCNWSMRASPDSTPTRRRCPAAAESWEYNDDATQITFHLRPDLKYSDGSPLDGGELPLRRGAHLRPGDGRRVPVHPLRDRRLRRVRRARRRRRRQSREYTPEEYDKAKAALGAKAVDDLTLQLDLTNPAPYFHTIACTLGVLPGQEGDRRRKTRTTGGRRPRTTSATDRSR